MAECEYGVSVGITLGAGRSFVISKTYRLLLVNERQGTACDLGEANVQRIEQLQSYLERLKIHAIDAPFPSKG